MSEVFSDLPPGALSLWKHQIYPQTRGPETMAEIAARVAKRHGLSVTELRYNGRAPRWSWPRQHAMYEMVETGKWSFPQIARYFGGMDHTTIIHGHRAHKRRNGL